jgi:hypothetical protein
LNSIKDDIKLSINEKVITLKDFIDIAVNNGWKKEDVFDSF